METQNLDQLDNLLTPLAEGKIIEGLGAYFADDLEIRGAGLPQKRGGTHCIAIE